MAHMYLGIWQNVKCGWRGMLRDKQGSYPKNKGELLMDV
jgi:hypothetical protein